MKNLEQYINKYINAIFIICVIIVFFFLGFHKILFLTPQGIHFFRQTDCLSFVQNYYHFNAPFLEPEVFNLNSNNGKAAGEFPILYYITAILYRIFAEHVFILRLLTFLITLTGFLFLLKMLILLTEDRTISLLFTLLFFSSTVLLYYSLNFLPDASALGFTFIGWYFVIKWLLKNPSNKTIILGFTFFTISSLLKVTYFIYPITAFFLIVYCLYINNKKARYLLVTLIFAISLIIVFTWNLYAIYYNKINNSSFFLTGITPIWKLNTSQILYILKDYVFSYWYSSYYERGAFTFFYIILIVGALLIKYTNKYLIFISLVATLGSICYFILFFEQFMDHDYYFLIFIPTLVFAIITSYNAINTRFPLLLKFKFLHFLLLFICIANYYYVQIRISKRYSDNIDSYSEIGNKLSGIRNFIDSCDSDNKGKFLILSDCTNNGGLFMINRKGWSICNPSHLTQDSLDYYITKGMGYIILTENLKLDSILDKKIQIQTKYTYNLRNVIIYKIDNVPPSRSHLPPK